MPGYANFVGGSKHKIIDRRTHPERHAQKKYIAARQFPYFVQREQGLCKEDLTFSFGWAPVNTSIEKTDQTRRKLLQEGSFKGLTHNQAQDEVELVIKKSKASEALDNDPVISFERNRQQLLAEVDWIGAGIIHHITTPSRTPECGPELRYGNRLPPYTRESGSILKDPSSSYSDSQQLSSSSPSKAWNVPRATEIEQQMHEKSQKGWKSDAKLVRDHEYMRSNAVESSRSRPSLYSDEEHSSSEYSIFKPPTVYCNPFLSMSVHQERCDDASRGCSPSHPRDRPQQNLFAIAQDTPLNVPNQIDNVDESGLFSNQLSVFSRSPSASQRSLNNHSNNNLPITCSQSSLSFEPGPVLCDFVLPNPFRALSILTGLPDISGDAM